jgi:hypothetical protein
VYPPPDAGVLAEIVAALPHLRMFTSMKLSDCSGFAAGHAELGCLKVNAIGPNITADQLARKCPRLHEIHAFDARDHKAPFTRGDAPGWAKLEPEMGSQLPPSVVRASFVKDRRGRDLRTMTRQPPSG